MKNYIILISCLSILFLNSTQRVIEEGSGIQVHKLEKSTLDKFKETTTIFVFSNIYEKEAYDKILKKSWTITPYEIVNYEAFNTLEYIKKGKYSVASIRVSKEVIAKNPSYKNSRILSLFTLKMYYDDLILAEYKPEMNDSEINFLIQNYEIDMAHFELFAKTNYLLDIYHSNEKTIQSQFERIYTEDLFYNYKLGMLQNCFQEINRQLIKEEEAIDLYGSIKKPELKKLTVSKLYIPEYAKINFSKEEEPERSKNKLKSIFSNYDYKYEFIDINELDKKIRAGEEVYYLRYIRRKNLQNNLYCYSIVNGKTGEIIYYHYIGGSDMFKYHMTTINKAIKKMAKT